MVWSSLGMGASLVGGLVYVRDENMEQAAEINGKVLCDFHAHPTHRADLDTIMNGLSSPGLVGLAVKDIDQSGKDILRYEQALDILPSGSFTEIDKGRLSRCGKGYFARTQEIQVGIHHVLALGWEGTDYFSNYETMKEAVDIIHSRKGIAILNHPFALVVGAQVRLPNSEEEEKLIQKAYGFVDEVEVHNGYCIDLIPGLLAMKDANRKAEALRQTEFPKFTGTASSDCHRRWEQIKMMGIYIPQVQIENGMDGIKNAIVKGDFTRLGDSEAGPYISRSSFLQGVLGDMYALYR